MTLQARLVHLCDIERDANTSDARDEGGYPLLPGTATDEHAGWAPHRNGVPCFFWTGPSRGERRSLEASTLLRLPRMLMALHVDAEPNDITRHDRIMNVRNRAGVVLATDLNVSHVDILETHVELSLSEVTP